MKINCKRLTALALTVVMIIGTMGLSVFADTSVVEASVLPAAVDGKITLTENVTLKAALDLKCDLDLGGKTLTLSDASYVKNAIWGNITVSNGNIVVPKGASYGDGIINVNGYAEDERNAEFNNVTITASDYAAGAGLIAVDNDTTLTVKNCSITITGQNSSREIGVDAVFDANINDGFGNLVVDGLVLRTSDTYQLFYGIKDLKINNLDFEGVVKEFLVSHCVGTVKNSKFKYKNKESETTRAVVRLFEGEELAFYNVKVEDIPALNTKKENTQIAFYKNTDKAKFYADADTAKYFKTEEQSKISSPVAKIGNEYYASFESAVAAAKSGDTIDFLGGTVMFKTAVPTETVEIKNKNLTFTNGTFDLTGFGKVNSAVNAVFYIADNSQVKFEKINFTGKDYYSAFGIIYVNKETGDTAPVVTITDCDFNLENDGRIEGGILKGFIPENGKFVIKNSDFKGKNIISVIKNATVDIDNSTFDTECTRTEVGSFRNHAFRGLVGEIKNSTLKAKGFETGFKANTLTVTNSDISLTNSNNGDNVVGCTDTLVLKSGNFSFDPTPYLEDGKTAVTSQKDGYLFTIGDKSENITVTTEVKPEAPEISVPENVDVSNEAVNAAKKKTNSAETKEVLKSATTDIKNDETIVNSKKVQSAVEDLKGDDPETEVSLVVVPKIEMEVKDTAEEDGVKTVSVEIEATYDLVATTDTNNMTDENSKKIETGKKLEVTKPIEITIPLPDSFNENDVVYIKHIKGDGTTYIYKGVVAADKTVTFTNPNGFSEFKVSNETPAAAIGDAYYETLSAAIDAAQDKDTIKLISDNDEEVKVKRTVSFTFDTNGKNFTGSITAGRNTTLAQDENKYYFVYTRPAFSSSVAGINVTYKVKFNSNGGSEVATVTVDKNEKVSEPKEPVKDGFEFDGWYTDKNLTTKYDFDKKVTANMTLYAGWTEIDKTDGKTDKDFAFVDVASKDWFYDNVKYAVENSLMNGISEKEFAPNSNLTRGMLVTILYRATGEPEINKSRPFMDVDASMYYANAVIWAHQNNIVNGITENEFAPEENITREQIATIIYRYAKYMEYDTSVAEDTNILSYADFDEVSEYAIEALQYAVGSGLIKGKTESTINPKDFATRAEVAAILNRFIEGNK